MNFLLICHERPDGDAIGSLLAMDYFLQKIGKHSTRVCVDPVPMIYNFLKPEFKRDFLLAEYDAIILIDNGDLNRTGFPDRVLLAKQKGIPIVNIDHHTKNDLWKVATVNYVDESASSTAELILGLLQGFGVEIDRELATALLTGLHNDTGGFKHSNTSPKVLENVSFLLAHGARLKLVSDNIANNRSVNAMKLWGIALERLKYDSVRKIGYSVITKNDIKMAKTSEDEVSGLVNLICAVPEIKIALLLYETADGKIKGSLRTENNNVNLAFLAGLLGGGGHKKAAGFTVDGRLIEENGEWRVV